MAGISTFIVGIQLFIASLFGVHVPDEKPVEALPQHTNVHAGVAQTTAQASTSVKSFFVQKASPGVCTPTSIKLGWCDTQQNINVQWFAGSSTNNVGYVHPLLYDLQGWAGTPDGNPCIQTNAALQGAATEANGYMYGVLSSLETELSLHPVVTGQSELGTVFEPDPVRDASVYACFYQRMQSCGSKNTSISKTEFLGMHPVFFIKTADGYKPYLRNDVMCPDK